LIVFLDVNEGLVFWKLVSVITLKVAVFWKLVSVITMKVVVFVPGVTVIATALKVEKFQVGTFLIATTF
jgi:hypothetical protein